MENRKLIYLFGSMFAVLFSLFYLFLFNTVLTSANVESKTVYFNQVGLYKNSENSEKAVASLKEKDVEAFAIAKSDITSVVCGVSEDEATTKALQTTLDSIGITYIEKQVSFDDPDVIALWDQKEITKVLEMVKY